MSLKAALYELPETPAGKRRGRRPKKGKRLPTLTQQLTTESMDSAELRNLTLVDGTERALRLRPLLKVLWYTACQESPVQVVLIRDESSTGGKWRSTALLCTDVNMSMEEVVQGYCRRWSVEVMFPLHREGKAAPERNRPWYRQEKPNAFTQVLGRLRLALWEGRLFGEASAPQLGTPFAEMLHHLLHTLAVR